MTHWHRRMGGLVGPGQGAWGAGSGRHGCGARRRQRNKTMSRPGLATPWPQGDGNCRDAAKARSPRPPPPNSLSSCRRLAMSPSLSNCRASPMPSTSRCPVRGTTSTVVQEMRHNAQIWMPIAKGNRAGQHMHDSWYGRQAESQCGGLTSTDNQETQQGLSNPWPGLRVKKCLHKYGTQQSKTLANL